MSRPLDPFPGGEGCPLDAFRRRVICVGWGLSPLVVGAFVMWIVWR